MYRTQAQHKPSNDFVSELLTLSKKLTGIQPPEIDHANQATLIRIGQFLEMDHAFIIGIDPVKGVQNADYAWSRDGIASLRMRMMATSVEDMVHFIFVTKNHRIVHAVSNNYSCS